MSKTILPTTVTTTTDPSPRRPDVRNAPRRKSRNTSLSSKGRRVPGEEETGNEPEWVVFFFINFYYVNANPVKVLKAEMRKLSQIREQFPEQLANAFGEVVKKSWKNISTECDRAVLEHAKQVLGPSREHLLESNKLPSQVDEVAVEVDKLTQAAVPPRRPKPVAPQQLPSHALDRLPQSSEGYLPAEFDPAYETEPVDESEEEPQTPFLTLDERIASYKPGGWFKLKSEKEWSDDPVADASSCFSQDLAGLRDVLRHMPLQVLLSIPENLVDVEDLERWSRDAELALQLDLAHDIEGKRPTGSTKTPECDDHKDSLVTSTKEAYSVPDYPKRLCVSSPENGPHRFARYVIQNSVYEDVVIPFNLPTLENLDNLKMLDFLGVPENLRSQELENVLNVCLKVEISSILNEEPEIVPDPEVIESSQNVDQEQNELQDWLDDLLT
ncbi:unnamed protein product [Notodromas monacha]|uniref:Uncharacterized protein n=1 Tax=Notodromas monacha TaxID=399045 RepID=A0A7R9BQ58_9CRUS|nr:unnamed protein product [Notodromas monacha]CAG0919398.1 unnamed protein product [Notodromas monacha]